MYEGNPRKCKAFERYIQGDGPKKISEALGIPIGTVNAWHRRDKWKKRRDEIFELERKTLHEKLLQRVESNANKLLDAIQLLSHMGLESINQIYKEKIHLFNKEDFDAGKVSIEDVVKWSRILNSASNIQKNVMPSANEDLVERMYEEYKRLNERLDSLLNFDEESNGNGNGNKGKKESSEKKNIESRF